jgi:ribose 5-phosphate isomerase A
VWRPAFERCVRLLAERDQLKEAAAERALQYVESGMLLGLGSGTTSRLFIEGLIRRAEQGLRVTAVCTSLESARMAREAGIEVVEDLDRAVDLAIDGADEIDPSLNLVKGHGGALFREKLVALAARRFLVIADDSKLVPRLGQTYVPVEVLPFLWRRTGDRLLALADRLELRGGEREPFRTDNGNLILDLTFHGGLPEPERTAAQVKSISGVLEHGLFIGIASACLVAAPEGVRVLEKT